MLTFYILLALVLWIGVFDVGPILHSHYLLFGRMTQGFITG